MAIKTETISAHPTSYDTVNYSWASTNTSYPISNGYADSSSTTYARINLVTGSQAESYIYYKFDFSDIPSDATITSVTASAKANVSTTNTTRVATKNMQLATGFSSNITMKGSATSMPSTAASTTISSVGSWTLSEVKDAGIRYYAQRGTGSTTSTYYFRIYGATMTVTYQYNEITYTVTSSLNGSGIIDPSGSNDYPSGEEFELYIEPTDKTATVSATRNGIDITSQLIQHSGGESTVSNVLGTYSLISGGFNGSGATYFSGIVGHGYDTSTTTTSNYYSSSSGTNAVFHYAVPFEDIPSQAEITNLYMMVNGHAESTSQSNEYMCVQLKSGSTVLSEQFNFKSAGTSNSTQTITATTLPTISQLENLVIECTLGYYGGAINGATVFLTYELDSVYYIYTTTVTEAMTIIVTIGGSTGPTLYVKESGTWNTYSRVYKKVNGSWVEQASSSWATLFNTDTNYVKG